MQKVLYKVRILAKCDTKLLLADFLTKPLDRVQYLLKEYTLLGGSHPQDGIRKLILPCGTEISTENLENLEILLTMFEEKFLTIH